jgi:predicted transglutaminase-like cysteine proteinase
VLKPLATLLAAASAVSLAAPVWAQGASVAPTASAATTLDPTAEDALQALLAEPEPPDAFGYPATQVDAAVPDPRWASLQAHASAAPPPGEWGQLTLALKGRPLRTMAETVNGFVNRHVALAADRDVWGVDDYWADLEETIEAGRGDCEDFAIAKMRLMEAAGAPSRDLYLLLVGDLGRGVDHAVLLVRDGADLLMLDSTSDRVLPIGQVTRYRPIMAFSGGARWLFRPDLVDVAAQDDLLSQPH